MDPGKERKVKVLDFRGQIKKDSVVASFNKNQAARKAVARQKARLVLSPKEKLPAPFKVILYLTDQLVTGNNHEITYLCH
jgi:hypothetical protein